jgi:predicted MFS family arabinose efflux permease
MYQAPPWPAVAMGAVVLQFAGGIVLAVLYACMPILAPSPSELGRGYGLLNQTGSIGSLLGPPGLGYAVTRAGWSSATILVAAVTLAGLLLFLAATRRPAPSAR